MDNVHGPHGTARIVKHPVLLDVDVRRQLGAQLVDNVLDGGARVVAVAVDAALGQVLQVVQLKDVKFVEVLLGDVDDRGEQRRQEAEDGQEAADATTAVGAGGGRILLLRFQRHIPQSQKYTSKSVLKDPGAKYRNKNELNELGNSNFGLQSREPVLGLLVPDSYS